MKAIIFGAAGQDGYYLNQLLEARGDEVMATSRSSGPFRVDVRDAVRVAECINGFRPDIIFNLAATSSTQHSLLFEYHEVIATGSLNILEAVYRHLPVARVFLSGSGLQFRNTGGPIREQDDFDPRNAYSLARIHSSFAARYYRNLGLKVYVGYFFNHDSPRRSARHLNKRIIEDVKEIKAGLRQSIEIGDPNAEKEFGYAAEVMKGVMTLTGQDEIFEAVIGTGRSFTIRDWIEAVTAVAGIEFSPHIITEKEGFKSEYSRLVSAPLTMKKLGWEHHTTLEELAAMMYSEKDMPL